MYSNFHLKDDEENKVQDMDYIRRKESIERCTICKKFITASDEK